MFRFADDSRSPAEMETAEAVFIKVEPDINFEDDEEDNLLPDLPLQNDWDHQEKGKLLMKHKQCVFIDLDKLNFVMVFISDVE